MELLLKILAHGWSSPTPVRNGPSNLQCSRGFAAALLLNPATS